MSVVIDIKKNIVPRLVCKDQSITSKKFQNTKLETAKYLFTSQNINFKYEVWVLNSIPELQE